MTASDLETTILWVAITFATLFCWCYFFPIASKIFSYWFQPQLQNVVVPEANIETTERNNVESSTPPVSDTTQLGPTFCSEVKIVTSDSSDSLDSMDLPIAQRPGSPDEESKEEPNTQPPAQHAINILVMQIVAVNTSPRYDSDEEEGIRQGGSAV